jgi:hypothetical protein
MDIKFQSGNPDWKKPRRRPRDRWEDNIKMYFTEVICEAGDWVELAQV